jgi:hypothetical protein
LNESLFQTQSLDGFPQDQYFSQNMEKGQFGLATLLSNPSLADSSLISGLGTVRVFSDAVIHNAAGSGGFLESGFEVVVGQDNNGTIYSRRTDQDTWSELYKPSVANFGAGMVWGDDAKLYYVGDQYLGQATPWGESYIEGTISVVNGNATIEGTGTTWTSDNVNGRRIKILGVWYTATLVDFNTITLDRVYEGATASGIAYEIFSSWDDTFQEFDNDLTGDQAYEWATPFNFEGDLLIPRKNVLCRLNSDGSFNDESDFAFELPEGMYIRAGAGSANKILLGAEIYKSSRSYLVLWDNISIRSIAPWIPLKSKVQAIKPYIAGWIVITQREILYTDGYSLQILSEGIDPRLGENSFSVSPYGIQIAGDKLIIANQIGGYTRKKSGIYIFDITTRNFQYLAPLGTHTYNATPHALFLDTAQKLNLSVETTLPAKKHLSLIKETTPSSATLITNPLAVTGNKKYAEGVKLDLATLEGGETITATVAVKLAAVNRRLFGIQKAKIAGANTTTITVDGAALGDVNVGDEVTIMEGVNAGLVRHITAISGEGTATEVWTLDEALTGNIEQDAYMNLSPFRKVGKKTVTSATALRDMYFNAQNKYKGKEFLVKIVFSNLSVPIEVLSVAVVSEEQDYRT